MNIKVMILLGTFILGFNDLSLENYGWSEKETSTKKEKDVVIPEGFEMVNTTTCAAVTEKKDDAEEDPSGNVDLWSSDLELVDDGGEQQVGMRFLSLNIPQGANISEAYVQFTVDAVTNDNPCNLIISGEAVDDAAQFASTSNDISNRTKTTASVSWTPPDWQSVGDRGPSQKTVNISSIIQEIVNRPGYSPSSSIVIIIEGTGAREAEAYTGNANISPELCVTYGSSPPPINITSTVTHESQAGASDGEIDITATGGTPGYMYLWSNGATTEDITGLSPGSYTVTVTDQASPAETETHTAVVNAGGSGGSGCSNPTNVALGKTTTQSTTDDPATSFGAHRAVDGNYDSSGWPPTHYSRTTWENNSNPWWEVNLDAIYDITSIELYSENPGSDSEFEDVNIYLSDTPFPPGGPTGAALETITGFVGGPTTFDYSSSPVSGQYLRIRKNDIGRLRIVEVVVNGCLQNSAPEALDITLNPTNPTAPNGNDGSIEAIVTGGEAPYNYFWSIPNQGSNDALLENLETGIYSLTVIDNVGNLATDLIELTYYVAPLTVELIPVNASASNIADGSITSVVNGGWVGSGNYTFNWSNGSTDQNPINLLPGVYYVTIEDAIENVIYANATVGFGPNNMSLTSVVTEANCPGAPTGAIDLIVSGGTAPFTFFWSNGVVTEDIDNLVDGDYAVTVYDANSNSEELTITVPAGACSGGGGCSNSTNVALNKTATQSTTADPINSYNANRAIDGNFNTSGWPPTHYSRTEYEDFPWWEVDLGEVHEITGLNLFNESGNSPEFKNVNIYLSDSSPADGPSGTLIETITGEVGIPSTSFDYSTNPLSGRYLRIKRNDTYRLRIVEAEILGCIPSGGSNLGLNYSVSPVTAPGQSDGGIIINPYGGTSPYSFDWGAPYGTTMNLSMIEEGDYTVTVTDGTGLSITETITVILDNITPPGVYHNLNKKLDGGLVFTNFDKLRFKYNEKYDPGPSTELTYKVYDDQGLVADSGDADLINESTNSMLHHYGINYYQLPLYQLFLPQNNVYTLEVSGGNKDEVYYIRFLNYCPENGGCSVE